MAWWKWRGNIDNVFTRLVTIQTADAEAITEMKEKLLKIVQPITEKLYKGQEEEVDEHDEL